MDLGLEGSDGLARLNSKKVRIDRVKSQAVMNANDILRDRDEGAARFMEQMFGTAFTQTVVGAKNDQIKQVFLHPY
ncbi:MAG: hypothetical protein ACKO9H_06650, partial [Planctomycetota bacterium]